MHHVQRVLLVDFGGIDVRQHGVPGVLQRLELLTLRATADFRVLFLFLSLPRNKRRDTHMNTPHRILAL